MSLKNKRILLTGGAGFIGSHIVESLLARGVRVIVFDNFSSGKRENLKRMQNDIEIIEGDILDYNSLLKACRGVDIISHHAAQLEIFKCIEDPVSDLRTNTIGTLNVLNAARANNVEKVINASSVSVYGQAQEIPEIEEHPTNPQWAYGVSKLAAEKYCQIYHDYYHLPVVSLRYGMVYGEREWFGRALTIFIKRVLANEPPVIFGDGSQTRDYIYVKDAVAMHNLCLEKKEDSGEVFNVGSGIGTRISDLAKMVIECSGKRLEPLYEDVGEGAFSKYITYRRRVPAELKTMVMGIEKAKKELGWSPKTSLKQGIAIEMEWISRNLDAWKVEGIVRI